MDIKSVVIVFTALSFIAYGINSFISKYNEVFSERSKKERQFVKIFSDEKSLQKELIDKELEIIKAEFTTDPDTRDYTVSSQKFYDTGFECKYDLDDGIRQLITAYSIIESPWYANY